MYISMPEAPSAYLATPSTLNISHSAGSARRPE